VPDGDHYRLFGQKIFITWGDHDLTANTVHMVLGRIEGAPPGVKGMSLSSCPKVLVNADGSLGARNDVRCLSIERKLGIHASPTCVLAFGEKNGAVGHLVGGPAAALEYMFVMMNRRGCRWGARATRSVSVPCSARRSGRARACRASRRWRSAQARRDHQSPRREAHASNDEVAEPRHRVRSLSIPPFSLTWPPTAG